MSLVLEIDKAQSKNSDIDALMGIIHERLHAIMDVTNFFIAICDRQRSYFQIPYFKDSLDTRRVHKEDRFPIERNNGLLTVDVLLSGQTMVLDRPAIAQRDRLRGKAEVSERLAEHWIGIPLFDSFQTLMGAMVTQSYDPERGYSEEDVALLTMIASLLAAALEREQRRNALELAVAQRTRQLEEEVAERRKAEQVQRALFEIASTNIDPQNPDKHYAELHRIIAGLLPAPNFFVAFYDPSSNEADLAYVKDEKDAAIPRRWKLGKGLLSLVLRSNRAWLIDQKLTHALIASGEIQELVGDTSYVSWMGAPMQIDGVAIGAIVMESYSDAIVYTQKDLEILGSVARHISTSMSRLRAIGDLHQTQQELVQKNATLTTKTQELSDAVEELRHLRDVAESATRAKSGFLANMSHEIRTPMNAIIGLSSLALKNDMPPRVQDYLHKIRNSGEHLLGIINDVLDISKIEAGKLEIEHLPFALEDVMDNVVSFISEKADAKGLELLCSIDRNVPDSLVGDPLRLGQVLINYTSNAVKFTSQGQVLIHVSVQEQTGTDMLLCFEVTDTGIGLSEAQIARIFQTFAQADGSITRQYGGSGLGLAISKSLAQGMGGAVGVRSTVGKGSTFWFTARVGKVDGSSRRLASIGVDMRGKRVLVVDDNEDAAHILRDILQEIGFVVALAHSGEVALQMLQQAHAQRSAFDFVLMDWLMPGMDGLQTIRAIQELPLQQAPFILMVTAHRRQELVQSAQSLGVQHVLAKPVSGSVLLDTMMDLLVHSGTRSLAPKPVTLSGRSYHEGVLQTVRGARILLVEDNLLNQQVAYELLTDAGFEVDIAEDGQRAVNSVEARVLEDLPYDIVLMDMQMPVMDGVTASRLIRLNHKADKLPIVAITANAMQEDRERCLTAGMNDFVTKPILPALLWQTLVRWIAPRPGLGLSHAAPYVPQAPQVQHAEPVTRTASPAPLPDRIEGLDMERGLALMGNNQSLYLKTLHAFVGTQHDAINDVRHMLLAEDLAAAERMAHTLKGQAAYLGAADLQSRAGALEDLLNTAQKGSTDLPRIEAAMQAVAVLLAALVQAVREAFAAGPSTAVEPSPEEPVDTAQAAVLAQRLHGLVESNDPEALDLLEQNRAALQQHFGDRLQGIERALQGFDFEAATGCMKRDATA